LINEVIEDINFLLLQSSKYHSEGDAGGRIPCGFQADIEVGKGGFMNRR
jgi:hypothetical protein